MKALKNVIILILFSNYFFIAAANNDSIKMKADAYSKRVIHAKKIAHHRLKKLFKLKGINYPATYIYWRAFKEQGELELWASNSDTTAYTLIKTFKICAVPGNLGPKRKLGDQQVPEGFYHISKFNPYSLYWLSFEISYPNKSDSILGYKYALGGEIYIHGGCKTEGCLPMTDSVMCEVYYVSAMAYSLDTTLNIPFAIFPTHFNKENWFNLRHSYGHKAKKISLWKNIEEGYHLFNQSKIPPKYTINRKGQYIFIKP